MPLTRVAYRPGIERQVSTSMNEGGWSDASRVRFRDGLPQAIGGWEAMPHDPILGRPRGLLSWSFLTGDRAVAIGTTERLYVLSRASTYDVTPLLAALAGSNTVATTSGSTTVTVTTTSAHGMVPGDRFRLAVTAAVGGITPNGDWTVLAAPSNTQFSFTHSVAASSTESGGGGTVTVTPFLANGLADSASGGGSGYGTGGFGDGAFSSVGLWNGTAGEARTWALDAWGQMLLAAPSDGPLVAFSPQSDGSVSGLASLVTNATDATWGPPKRIGSMLVAPTERHVILLGTSDLNSTANYDPLRVRFSDVEDHTMYLASATNSAGSFRLTTGTRIMGGYNAQLVSLIWTDTALYSMRFVGAPFVYSFNLISQQCGAISRHAWGALDGVVYWMSSSGFFRWAGGAAEQIRCSMLDTVFEQLNKGQVAKVWCATNAMHGEVWWFYPSEAGTGEVDRYVCFNPREGAWYGGALDRTCWIDRGVFPQPMAMSPSGQLYQHEVGTTAAGSPLGEFIESGYADLGDGTDFMFVDRCLPDFTALDGPLSLTLRVTDYPFAAARSIGPFEISPSTLYRTMRARGRQVAVRLDGAGTGFWRLGAMRFNTAPAGKR